MADRLFPWHGHPCDFQIRARVSTLKKSPNKVGHPCDFQITREHTDSGPLRLILIKLIKEFPKERYDWTKLSWKTELDD